MRLQFQTVDVFTGTQFVGNPLAVVLNAEGLSTGQMQAIAWDNQGEFRRDTDRAGYLQQGSGGREVANSAIDGDAAKLDDCGFQDAVASCDPCFDHPIEICQKLKESIKNPSAIS